MIVREVFGAVYDFWQAFRLLEECYVTGFQISDQFLLSLVVARNNRIGKTFLRFTVCKNFFIDIFPVLWKGCFS